VSDAAQPYWLDSSVDGWIVLAPGGRAIHVMPSTSWRMWCSLLHFVAMPRDLTRRIRWRLQRRRAAPSCGPAATDAPIAPRSAQAAASGRPSLPKRLWRLVARGLFDPRHGERGNPLTELWLFSRPAWHRLFRRTGWVVESSQPLHLAYTGHVLFGTAWSTESRTRWSRLLGSSTHVTVLRAAARS